MDGLYLNSDGSVMDFDDVITWLKYEVYIKWPAVKDFDTLTGGCSEFSSIEMYDRLKLTYQALCASRDKL